MKHRYEGLLILNIKGSEDTAKDIIDRLEKDFTKDGASVEQVQKMDRRHFSYVAGELESGFYVNFVFEAAPQSLDKMRARLKLDEEVYRQSYIRLPDKKVAAKPARRAKAAKEA